MISFFNNWKKIAVFSSLFLFGCTAFADDLTPTSNDPYETFNRHAYAMNKTLDKIILKPLAITYKTILPWPLTRGIDNFFNNVDTITTVINDVLQGKIHHAGVDTGRLLINTTVGIGGLVDAATYFGIPKHYEDFGLTLAQWGYKSSSYLVLPLFGPSTFRDALGMPVDFIVFSPYSLMPWHSPWWQIRYSLLGLYYIDHRAVLLDYDNVLNQAALDEYSFVRDAYLQHRASLINDDGVATDIYLGDDDSANSTANNSDNSANNKNDLVSNGNKTPSTKSNT